MKPEVGFVGLGQMGKWEKTLGVKVRTKGARDP